MGFVRLFFFILLLFVVWKLVQAVFRMLQNTVGKSTQSVHGSKTHRSHVQQFKDVKDAEFEDITPRKEPNNGSRK